MSNLIAEDAIRPRLMSEGLLRNYEAEFKKLGIWYEHRLIGTLLRALDSE